MCQTTILINDLDANWWDLQVLSNLALMNILIFPARLSKVFYFLSYFFLGTLDLQRFPALSSQVPKKKKNEKEEKEKKEKAKAFGTRVPFFKGPF